MEQRYDVIVIGGGHAGVEAAWAAANMLGESSRIALVTMDPSKVGAMSCNPAIGGLAKGQMVREIDALNGLMALATDATGIQFKVLNMSKGAAVRGPRAQCDKHAYAEEVQRLIASRPQIHVIAGSVERLLVRDDAGTPEGRVIEGVVVKAAAQEGEAQMTLHAAAVVLTTGTFMRGLMHTGEHRREGGRFGEGAAIGISGALRELGFELGRLKTGTPPRLKRSTIDWASLQEQRGDEAPEPFSELSRGGEAGFPKMPQVDCRITRTGVIAHEAIRANLHRAPMFSGQIEGVGPRYCPSVEDKIVRFADKDSHHVYLEPESLRNDWIYCNGISTSLPADVQDVIVRSLPGCECAEILRYGYAVEYDMVRPHQIRATAETKLIAGLFLAGQINGTSGYEEAAAQGLIAGINAARRARGQEAITLGRHEAYIGVLMDDLATKTPIEPYRMFTSRAEHRLLLRCDNAPDRLTQLAESLGLLAGNALGERRREMFAERRRMLGMLRERVGNSHVQGQPLSEVLRRPDVSIEEMRVWLALPAGERSAEQIPDHILDTLRTDCFYEPYARRHGAIIARQVDLDRKRIPHDFDYAAIASIRSESRAALLRFKPATLGQASRLEGMTPADVTLLAVLISKHRRSAAGQ